MTTHTKHGHGRQWKTHVWVQEAVEDEEEGSLQRVADGEEVGEDEGGGRAERQEAERPRHAQQRQQDQRRLHAPPVSSSTRHQRDTSETAAINQSVPC